MKKVRTIFHIDVNSAYLSWEAVYRLQHGESIDLREIPSIVGGDPKTRHGIVLTKSIPAKKYKIQTGETIYSALQKCPNLTIVPPTYGLYIKCSNAMVEMLKEYSPTIQRYSVDECFLDYTNMEKHFGDPITAAHTIKDRIHKELGFTVNIGVSVNKFLAKMASDFTKPNRVHTLYPKEVPEKMWPLPIEDLFMVGRATAPKLHKIGICTIGDLAKCNLEHIRYMLKSHGKMIWKYANGIEDSKVRLSNYENMKGIGNSTTIAFDVDDKRTAHMILLGLTETVSLRLRDAKYCCKVITVEIKNKDFMRYTHQRKLFAPTDTTNQIYKVVKELFNESWKGESIRHLGVRVSDFCTNQFQQRSFFDEVNLEKTKALDATIDKIRSNFGSNSIVRASFLHSRIKPLIGGVGTQDYLMMSSLL
ncbi:DNA polymerase Y family protein [Crassaminicella profunda]|uniref:DNA polymerase Y family protein n=1 Tax=Crassaminicella profunda TaxID=1286698 RepID=UPI001CA665E4|nr:DNA polymerase IV [Crassaminicella profunda]QZY56631.1 DNA polymerase IV [Crassaminicella profunda]